MIDSEYKKINENPYEVNNPPEIIEKKLEKTRKLSIVEGSAASVSTGAGENYIPPYALALNANNAQIGLLSSFPGILGPLAQIFGSRLMEKYDRKKLIILFVSLQAASWLLFVVAGILFLKSFAPDLIIPFLITSYIINVVFGSFVSPSWFSMMGDIVPEKIRGRYFSKRNRIAGIVSIIATIVAAFWLDYTKNIDIAIIGFICLFIICSIGRFISAYYFTKHYVPKIKLEKGYYFSFFQFIKKAPTNNFGKFAIYVALINLTVSFAGPFFAVYMLKDLNFNYFWFTIVNISSGVFSILIMPLWGKFADKYGNRQLLKIGSLIVPFIPILWLFNTNPIYLILVPQLVSGLGWAAFNLGASNFIYDAVTVQRRGIILAYYSILNGIAVFIGAGLGGLTAQYLNISFMNVFLFIFLISGIARLLVVFLMLTKIKEVRENVTPIRLNPFVYLKEMHIMSGISHPVSGVQKALMHPKELEKIFKKKK
ncbi:MAG: MFS transporter, partial [Nanoarchaeota archaeon]